MSIDKQLKLGLKQTASQLSYPPGLDEHVYELFEKHAMKKASPRVAPRRKSWSRIAIIAASLLLFSGVAYASAILYKLQTTNLSIEVTEGTELHFSDTQLKQIRESIHEARQQLAPGESAFVYIAELDRIKLPGAPSGLGLMKVNQPAPYPDMKIWLELLNTTGNFSGIKIPVELPHGFTFNHGELESPTGMLDAVDMAKYYKPLQQQAAEANQAMAWQKAQARDIGTKQDFITESPRLIYVNSSQDQIEISYSVTPTASKNTDVKIKTSPSTTSEKLQVAGYDAFYTLNSNSFLSDTGVVKDIHWLEQKDGRTIDYHVSSSSLNVSKEDLLLVANHMR
jgi:hypothetical protein